MDPRNPRDSGQYSGSRPNTLGQTWRKAHQPGQPNRRRVGDLPPLPDWPPLPEERAASEWPALGPSLRAFAEPASDAARPRMQPQPQPGSAAKPSWRSWLSELEIGRRWRGASKRRRLSIALLVVLPLLLIVACAGVAAHSLGELVGSAVAGGAPGAQQNSGLGAASGSAQQTPANMATATAPAPTSTPTSAPTASLPTQPPVQPLTLAITCASGAQHGYGRLCVHTLPSSTLSLTVTYCDGSKARGLRSGAADANGDYTWNWQIRGLSCAGPANATVTASANGQSTTATTSFAINS